MSIATAMSHNTNNQTCRQPTKRTSSHTQAWEKKREWLTNKRPNGQPSMTVTTTTTPSTATTLQGILNITLERRGISVQTRGPHLCLLVHGPWTVAGLFRVGIMFLWIYPQVWFDLSSSPLFRFGRYNFKYDFAIAGDFIVNSRPHSLLPWTRSVSGVGVVPHCTCICFEFFSSLLRFVF